MSRPRVAVVGAGIAGLTLAAWLRRGGMECVIYERAARPRADGIGIQLSPNGARLLHRLGLADALDRVAARPPAIEVRRWRDGRVVGWTTLGPEGEQRYGAPYYTLSRRDLYRCLLDAAGGRIRTGHRLAGLDAGPAGVALSFVDTPAARADVVVGADGIGSVVRAALSADRPRPTGLVAYRALVPAGRVPGGTGRVSIFVGPGRHCLWYPVSAELYSVAAVVPEPPASPPAPSPASPPADPVAGFAGWHPEVAAVLACADGFTRSPLRERDPLAHWSAGRVTVVGDAAHPMLPFAAQGANQAIESAATLGACLLAGDCPEAALERYAALRRPRLERVAALVRRNAGGLHVADGAAQGRRDRDLAEAGDYGWLFGYDAEAAVTRTAIGAGAPT